MPIALRLVRGGLLGLGLSALILATAPRVPPSHHDEIRDPFAAALVDAAELAIFGVSTWLALAALFATIGAVRGPQSIAARVAARVTPRLAARALGAMLGSAVCLGPVAAHATYDDSEVARTRAPETERVRAPDIAGLRLPDRPGGALLRPLAGNARSHVVRRGDTLWDIAAAGLPPGSTSADTARACRRWYAANRAAIGDNPNLLLPGTHLYPPTDRRRTP